MSVTRLDSNVHDLKWDKLWAPNHHHFSAKDDSTHLHDGTSPLAKAASKSDIEWVPSLRAPQLQDISSCIFNKDTYFICCLFDGRSLVKKSSSKRTVSLKSLDEVVGKSFGFATRPAGCLRVMADNERAWPTNPLIGFNWEPIGGRYFMWTMRRLEVPTWQPLKTFFQCMLQFVIKSDPFD